MIILNKYTYEIKNKAVNDCFKLIHISLGVLICPHLNIYILAGSKMKKQDLPTLSILINYKLIRFLLEFPNQEC